MNEKKEYAEYMERIYEGDRIIKNVQMELDKIQSVNQKEKVVQHIEKQKKSIQESFLQKGELTEEEVLNLFSTYTQIQTEYLVNGATLTCTNATLDPVFFGSQKEEYAMTYYACKTQKLTQSRLVVTENQMNMNGLNMATIADSKIFKNIIPFSCNCSNLPNRSSEIKRIEEHKSECKKYGNCLYLMNLNDLWENLPSQVGYFSYIDDVKGKIEGINMTSVLFCKHGGFIYPVDSGQSLKNNSMFTYYDKDGKTVIVEWPITNEEFRNSMALSQEEIEKICYIKNPKLVELNYDDAIFYFCKDKNLNPKVLLATLGNEQNWCRNGNYEKAFGVGVGGHPESFSNSNVGVAASCNVYIKWFEAAINEKSLILLVNQDKGPQYSETKAGLGQNIDIGIWQNEHDDYVKYMEAGQEIKCVNAAMYAKLKYTPWVDFPPQNSHPLEDWLSIYNSLEEIINND